MLVISVSLCLVHCRNVGYIVQVKLCLMCFRHARCADIILAAVPRVLNRISWQTSERYVAGHARVAKFGAKFGGKREKISATRYLRKLLLEYCFPLPSTVCRSVCPLLRNSDLQRGDFSQKACFTANRKQMVMSFPARF